MADMDEIAYVDSLDDESLFEWDDESADDESIDDESYFRPPQRSSSRSSGNGRQRTRLAQPMRLPQRYGRAGAAASLVSNDRRLEQNDQRLAQNEKRLAQGQDQLASKVSQLDKNQDTQLSKLSKFEKNIDQRIKSLEASSQLAMFLPLLLNSQPELQSFTEETTGRVVTVKPNTTQFSDSGGLDPIMLLAFSQMGSGAATGKNGGDQGGMLGGPLGLLLMLKLLDK